MVSRIRELLAHEFSAITGRPRQVILELTYRCNLRCRTCGIRNIKPQKVEDELSTDQICRLIDSSKQMGVSSVMLVGAEPLIRKDINSIIEYTKSKGMKCSVITNGTLITTALAANMVSQKLDYLTVSVDAPNELQDEIRKGSPASFSKTLAGIEEIKTAKKNTQSGWPWINIHTTVSSLNVGILQEMALFADKLGVDSLSFQYLSETQSDAVKQSLLGGMQIASERFIPHNGSFLLKKEQLSLFRRELDGIRRLRKKNDLIVDLKVLSLLSDPDLIKGRFPVKRCCFIRDTILIDPYGCVFPCANMDGYVLGDVRTESIHSIWGNERRRLLKKSLAEKLFPICYSCCHFKSNLTLGQMVKAKLLDSGLKFSATGRASEKRGGTD